MADAQTGVHRFTTRYVAAEDRLRLSVELKQGEVRVLWLTRRLLNRLVPRLLERLDGPGAAAPPAGTAAPEKARVVQQFTQAAAVGAIRKQPAVAPSEATPQRQMAYVVTEVDIRSGPRALVLDLKGAADMVQPLPFTEEALRQWLGVVKSQYEAGGWREALWPDWMEAPEPAQAARHLN